MFKKIYYDINGNIRFIWAATLSRYSGINAMSPKSIRNFYIDSYSFYYYYFTILGLNHTNIKFTLNGCGP